MSAARAGSVVLVLARVFPGAYAWLATVAVPALQRDASGWARATALSAPFALIAGAVVAVRSPRPGRMLGVVAFVVLCAASWLLNRGALDPVRLDPVRAALGGAGWLFFALSWGMLRGWSRDPENDPNVILGAELRPRGRLPKSAWITMAVSLVGALLLSGFAWIVVRPGHALLAHGTALGCSLALVASGARIALLHGGQHGRRSPDASRRVEQATLPLTILALALAVGLVWLVIGWSFAGAHVQAD